MRSLVCILILSSFLVFNSGNAQWEQISNGMFGGSISSMCFCDSGFFIGTYRGGMFKSTDYGESWFSINEGLSSLTIHDLTYVDGYIIAATDGKINYSTNYGNSWKSYDNKRLHSFSSITHLGNYILSSNSGIMISKDFGKNWTKISNKETSSGIRLLKVFDGNIFVGSSRGLYLSPDTGKSWRRIDPDTNNNHVYNFEVYNNYIYLIVNCLDSGIVHVPILFRSSNFGKDWEEIGQAIKEKFIYDIFRINGFVILVTKEGLYSSLDNGESWKKINSINSIYNIFTYDDYIFLTTWHGEIFRSIDFGNSWINSDKGITALYIDRLNNIGDKIIAGSSFRSFYTTNNGESWLNECFDSCNYSITSIVKGEDSYYAGTRSNGIFKSTDGGKYWFSVNDGLTNLKINKLINVNDNILVSAGDYLEEGNGVFLLNPDGISWQERSNGLTDRLVYDFVNIDSIIFAGTHTEGIFKTDNYGINWVPVEINLNPYTQRITCLAVQDNRIFAGEQGEGLFVSDDFGESWQKTGNKERDMISDIIVSDSILYVSSLYNGIFMSSDRGKSWIEFNEGLVNKQITCLLISGDYLYTGTNGSGVWRYKTND